MNQPDDGASLYAEYALAMLEVISVLFASDHERVIAQHPWTAGKGGGLQMSSNHVRCVRTIHAGTENIESIGNPFEPSRTVEVVAFPQAQHHIVIGARSPGGVDIGRNVPPLIVHARPKMGVQCGEHDRLLKSQRTSVTDYQGVMLNPGRKCVVRRNEFSGVIFRPVPIGYGNIAKADLHANKVGCLVSCLILALAMAK
jgi:hypothetical protein